MRAVRAGYEQFGIPVDRVQVETPLDQPADLDPETYSTTPGSHWEHRPVHVSEESAELAEPFEKKRLAEQWGDDPESHAKALAFYRLNSWQQFGLRNGFANPDLVHSDHARVIEKLNIPGADDEFVAKAAAAMARRDPRLSQRPQ